MAMTAAKYRFLLTLGLFLLSIRGCAWFNGKYVETSLIKFYKLICCSLQNFTHISFNTGIAQTSDHT